MESILLSVKKLLGIQPLYNSFDADIIIHINAAFATLQQLGVGPKNGFMIDGECETWNSYSTKPYISFVRTYVYLKVRLAFDPPSNSALLESINAMISELEWRIHIEGGDDDE